MVTEFNRENHAKNLPDSYAKHKESNNFKILEIERTACDKSRETLSEIDSILDFNNARGATLDLYGDRIGCRRNGLDDDRFLYKIKAKIAQDLSSGSLPSIQNALSLIFGYDPSTVSIKNGDTPCTVAITQFPLDTVIELGFTLREAGEIIQSLLPVGVRISEMNGYLEQEPTIVIASAVTHSESHLQKMICEFFEELTPNLMFTAAITHAETHLLEVQ